jgi:hypothetical protein
VKGVVALMQGRPGLISPLTSLAQCDTHLGFIAHAFQVYATAVYQ